MTASYTGQQRPESGASHLNATAFLVQQLLSQIATLTLVQVKAVTNAGGVSPVGFVDVQPLVNMVDGAGNAVPHGTIYHLPYLRLQGGTSAVILDPAVGDIGICGFASRDVSSVKINKAQANPGSSRRFDMADGLYLGGTLNGAPVQYVTFSSAGITLVSPTQVTIQAPTITLDGNVGSTGTFTNNGSDIGSPHVHSNGNEGANTGPPVA